jgi:ABC-type sugar transport system ATPase subunit
MDSDQAQKVGSAIAARGVSKRFGALLALDDVDFELRHGEVHGLIGANGAGKSTLMALLSGALAPDRGTIELAGRPEPRFSPQLARSGGVCVIHQERQLCLDLTVAENLCLGSPPTTHRIIDRRRMRDDAARVLDLLGAEIDVDRLAGDITRAEQQIVEIARALGQSARVLLMDEPTAALSSLEAERLLELVSSLRAQGTSVVYVSHQLAEVAKIADRVSVLRDGQLVGTYEAAGLSASAVGRLMLGGETTPTARAHWKVGAGLPTLSVRELRAPGVRDVSFDLAAGEILALTGLLGAGHLEVGMAVFGASRISGGHIEINGKPIRPRTPADACAQGIGLVPPDRKTQGVLRDLSVAENATLPAVARRRLRTLTRSRVHREASRNLARLAVKASGLDAGVMTLSGGNQQKVVFGKWLGGDARVLVLAEPTSGIDIGARAELFALVDRLAQQGVAILLVSSDLGEVERLATRVLVMRRGEIVASLQLREIVGERMFAIAAGQPTPVAEGAIVP